MIINFAGQAVFLQSLFEDEIVDAVTPTEEALDKCKKLCCAISEYFTVYASFCFSFWFVV